MYSHSGIVKRALTILLYPVFGFLRRTAIINHSARNNIVVIAFHKIGDTVHTIPAITTLHKIYNDHLKIMCYPECKPVYQLAFKDTEIVVIDPDDFKKRRIAKRPARKKLKDLNPKFIYDLTGTVLSVSLIAGQSTEKVFGITEHPYTNLYSKYVFKRTTPHLRDLFKDAVETGTGKLPDTQITTKPRNSFSSCRILIHPFAGWKAKEWNFRKYIQLAGELNKEYDCALISPAGLITEEIKKELINLGISLIETGNLNELITEIEDCSLFIGNDSGPLYIASLLGVPTFTIYGPTNPLYSIPPGERNKFIQIQLKCSPEENKQYCFTHAGLSGCPAFECMNLLSITEVLSSVKELINMLQIKSKQNENTITV